jgi:hypothetical protein
VTGGTDIGIEIFKDGFIGVGKDQEIQTPTKKKLNPLARNGFAEGRLKAETVGAAEHPVLPNVESPSQQERKYPGHR